MVKFSGKEELCLHLLMIDNVLLSMDLFYKITMLKLIIQICLCLVICEYSVLKVKVDLFLVSFYE